MLQNFHRAGVPHLCHGEAETKIQTTVLKLLQKNNVTEKSLITRFFNERI